MGNSVVYLSVCLSVMTVSPTKTAKPIEMPFEVWTRVGLRNHACVRWRSRSPTRIGNFEGKGAAHCKVYRTLCCELCKSCWSDRNTVWDAQSGGSREPWIRWGIDVPTARAHLGCLADWTALSNWIFGVGKNELCKNWWTDLNELYVITCFCVRRCLLWVAMKAEAAPCLGGQIPQKRFRGLG